MKRNNKDAWLMTYEEFAARYKATRSIKYYNDIHNRHVQCGCDYYVYVDEDLNVINPYLEKNRARKVLFTAFSPCSRYDALKKAHQFIIKYATKEGLYDI